MPGRVWAGAAYALLPAVTGAVSATAALAGGVALLAGSYLIGSWLWMSLASIAVIFAIHWVMRRMS